MCLFLSRICQNVSCDDCRYRKKPRIADITQGDYWRVSKYHPEMNDNKGMGKLTGPQNLIFTFFSFFLCILIGKELDGSFFYG